MASTTRLETALDQGAFDLAGQLAVLRPGRDYDLPRDLKHARIQHSNYPDVAAWQGRGFEVSRDVVASENALVVVPRAKALARHLVALANQNATGLVIVDGQKTDGIDSLFRECRKRLGDIPSITKAHGRLFWFAPSDVFNDWLVGDPIPGDHGFYTTAGVFSDGQVDQGSALLAEALPELKGRVADLGAGWGYLSLAALGSEAITQIDLIEAEALSLDCARLNVTDPRATFHWGDATTFQPDAPYDAVICNPPFHAGRAADPDIGRAFIRAAAKILKPNGDLWLVANRQLPYEDLLRDLFRNGSELFGDNRFKLFHASRPKR